MIILIGLASWFYLIRDTEEVHTGPLDKLTIGVEASILPSVVWVAEAKGYFREEGIDLTIQKFDSGSVSLQALLKGEVDMCTVAPTPIMFNSFRRQDFSMISSFVRSRDDIKIIARKDKGIKTATDLRGKKIGTPKGTTGQFFTELFLDFNDISRSDVEIVNISPSGLPTALNNGQVDAIVIWEPHAFNAVELLRDNAVRLSSSEIYEETFNFVIRNNLGETNPGVLVRFIKAIDRGIEFMKDNENESQNIVANALKIDKSEIETLWSDFRFELSLSQTLITTLESEAKWAIEGELVESNKIPNYLNYIYFDALEAVKPEAISIFR